MAFQKGHETWNKAEHIGLTCHICDKEYLVKPYRTETSRFCSPECRYKSQRVERRKRQSLVCNQCGSPYDLPPSHARTSKYCSRRCQVLSQKGKGFKKPRSLNERFWEKVDIRGPDKCWEWQGYRNKQGYGSLMLYTGKLILAHRLAYVLTYGQIPDDIFVCHKCDNPPCCNPKHLFLGTRSDNAFDSVKKGRWNAGGPNISRGEKSHLSKLTDNQVRDIIKALRTGCHGQVIAKSFNVSNVTVYRIRNGKIWKHISSPMLDITDLRVGNLFNAKLEAHQVREIRSLLRAGNHTLVEIADMFHVSQGTVWNISSGRTYRSIK